jgi:putative ABC transport system permease protein
MALGAQTGALRRLLVMQGMKLTLIALILGLAAAFGLTRQIKGLLFGVSALDPLTYGFVVLLLVAVAWLACYVPARRATKVDPLVALRHE